MIATKYAKLVIPFLDLLRIKVKDLWTGNKDEGSLAFWEKSVRDVVGNPYSNGISYIVHKGTIFVFDVYHNPSTHIYAPNKYKLHLWDSKGHTDLGAWLFEDTFKLIPTDVANEIEAVMDSFIKGIVNCSDCQAPIPSDTRNRYFAGIYCNECWEREWKAREAKETYN